MALELERIGKILRERREELKFTLKEVESHTSIRLGYLHAIEEGKIFELISKVYAKGFLKQYANFLEIDFESMMHPYPAIFQFPEEFHEFSYGIGTLETRGSIGGGIKWLPSLFWVLGGLAVLLLGYTILKVINCV